MKNRNAPNPAPLLRPPWHVQRQGTFEMKMIVDSIWMLKFSQVLTDNLPCLNYVCYIRLYLLSCCQAV